MHASGPVDVYTPSEIARAAGVPLERVVAALGRPDVFLRHQEAVALGRALRSQHGATLFVRHTSDSRRRSLFFAVSSTLHAAVFAAVVFVTLTIGPVATALRVDAPREETQLVFLAEPGPGGGGGGGGLAQPTPPPKAMREGKRKLSSPVPARRLPDPVNPPERPKLPDPVPPPPAPLHSEPLPVLAAPIVAIQADSNDRIGVFEPAPETKESHGPGQGGGTGTGTGTGVGQGQGSGVGPGSGGGIGGGPYRPGAGITPPRLLHEVKADYTEEARVRGIRGEVVMEIVIRRDGTVGDTKILRRLGNGLDERAVDAVRQWRFAPAVRQGSPVDVLVEVSVEFKLR